MRLGVCGGEEVTFSILDANFKLQALKTLEENHFDPVPTRNFSADLLNPWREKPSPPALRNERGQSLEVPEILETLENLDSD